MAKYYLWLGQDDDRTAITVYDEYYRAERVAIAYRNVGKEVEICEFGYPFA